MQEEIPTARPVIHGDDGVHVPVTLVFSSHRGTKVGMFTVFLNVVRTENFFSLWRGVSPVSNQPHLGWNLLRWFTSKISLRNEDFWLY